MESYFTAPIPVSSQEFKIASVQYEEMKAVLERIGSEIRYLLLIKEFCNDHLWTQPDSDFKALISVCQLQEKFGDFMVQRRIVIIEGKERLQKEIFIESELFMQLWSDNLEFINMPFSKDGICESYTPHVTLKSCLDRVSNLLSISSSLCDKIMCIEGTNPEILESSFFLQSKESILINLIETENSLQLWRNLPISLLNFSSIMADCDKLLANVRVSSNEDIPLIEKLSKELLFLRKYEIPFVKRLRNAALV
jgi:hypothetical protein